MFLRERETSPASTLLNGNTKEKLKLAKLLKTKSNEINANVGKNMQCNEFTGCEHVSSTW